MDSKQRFLSIVKDTARGDDSAFTVSPPNHCHFTAGSHEPFSSADGLSPSRLHGIKCTLGDMYVDPGSLSTWMSQLQNRIPGRDNGEVYVYI